MRTNILTFLVSIVIVISVNAQNWEHNINVAKEKATKENKHILLVFSGSDWCAPCMKLDKNIWKDKSFQKLSKEKFIFLKVDFPRRKSNKLSKEQEKHNDALAEKYNEYGNFPLVVVTDKKGNTLGEIGYKKITPTAYYKELITLTK